MASIKISVNGTETTAEITQVKLPLADGSGYAYYDYASKDEATEPPETPGTQADGILYQLPEGTTFDGATSIDTGVKLLETDRDFSIVFEGTPTNGTICSFKDYSNTAAYYGGYLKGNAIEAYKNFTATIFSKLQYMKVAIVHTAGASTMGVYVKTATGSMETRTPTGTYEYGASDVTLCVGSRNGSDFYEGTMDQFIVYGKALSADELAEFFA